jgi:nitrogen fixation protein NifU and related proteins
MKASSETAMEHRGYSDKVIEHFENPRNAGSFATDDAGVATGRVGASALGAVMKIQIKVDAQGVIADTRFKAYGSGPAIACASLASDWVKGKTLAQAEAIGNSAIAEELALPAAKIHCAILAEDAIKAAVADYRRQHGASAEPEKKAAD